MTVDRQGLEACGGCGETNPEKRCIGCLHPFTAGDLSAALSGVKLTLNRDVPKSECHWLDRDMKCGETVYRYSGATYGCIGPDGTACSLDPDLGPFFELPRLALSQGGTDEASK